MIQMLLILNLAYSLAFAGVQRTLIPNRLNAPADTIQGTAFPRTSMLKYRGSDEVQMDRKKALQAMLGDYAPVESILYSALKLLLMKKSVPFYSTVRSRIESYGLHQKVADALKNNNNRAYTEDEAHTLAFKIIEDDLMGKLGNFFREHFLNYRSAYYELFPQEMLFSTVYLEVANIYSRHISVIEDSIEPMIDLNYWNKVYNGNWVFTVNPWVDKGEFISPIIIEPEKVIGFMEYKSEVPDYRVFRPLPNELDLAFMKHEENGEFQILVFDGTSEQDMAPAILKTGNTYKQADSRFNPADEIPQHLRARKGSAFLMGIIKLCPKNDECELRDSRLSDYRRSRRVLSKNDLKILSDIEINGLTPKMFYQEGTIKKSSSATAAYTEIPAADDIIDQEINSYYYSDSKVINHPDSVTPLSLSWDLSGEKLPKDKAIFFKIPDGHDKLKVKSVRLLHRQDNSDNSTPLSGRFDSSPSYTSVQFYNTSTVSSDPWRYWGGTTRFNNPYGSFFADLASEANMKQQELTNWNINKSVGSHTPLNENITPKVMRILGVGVDPATLYKIEVEFQP